MKNIKATVTMQLPEAVAFATANFLSQQRHQLYDTECVVLRVHKASSTADCMILSDCTEKLFQLGLIVGQLLNEFNNHKKQITPP